ncbi:hypothetical protein [Tropicibacter alexandrii]|uniref:hypothetical protein n=1 Tax=Tropicibacter alexandrii TaxID=2267683 RepID=UPI000EF4EC71|nr:hypothetical protein [Tropicibacter alexandrii]
MDVTTLRWTVRVWRSVCGFVGLVRPYEACRAAPIPTSAHDLSQVAAATWAGNETRRFSFQP